MRTGKRSGATTTGKRTASVIVCSTLATNGISRPVWQGRTGRGWPRRQIDAPDLPFAPDHQPLRVRQPRVLRVRAEDRPGLLLILVQPREDRPLGAGREAAHEQLAAGVDAADERQPLPVGRDARRDRAAGAAHDRSLTPRRQLAADDRVDAGVRVLVVLEGRARRDVLAVVEELAVGRERRLAGVLLEAHLLGHLDAVGAAAVVHPHLAGAERPRRHEVLAGEDEVAVRAPRSGCSPTTSPRATPRSGSSRRRPSPRR